MPTASDFEIVRDGDLLRLSDLRGFWKRLKKLGFSFQSVAVCNYRVAGSPYTYQRHRWRFRGPAGQRAVFYTSKHGYRMMLVSRQRRTDTRRACWSHLEWPFLLHFKQTDRPLSLRRLGAGVQRPEVAAWLQQKALAAAAKRQRRARAQARKARLSVS